MNKKLLTIASLFACSSLTVLAEEAAADTTATVEAPAPAATLFEELGSVEALSNISLAATVGYESEYVFRGVELDDSILTSSLELGYAISENFGAYLGYWGAYATGASAADNGYGSENDIYMGAAYTYDFVTLDLGYTNYTYTAAEDTNEIKAVLTFDTSALFVNGLNLNPYIGFFYDFDFDDQLVTEIGLSYSIPVSQYITGGDWATLDIAYYMGFASYCESSDAEDYFYTGFAIDANIAINEIVGFSLGLRYAYNSIDDDDANSNIWFGTSMSIGF